MTVFDISQKYLPPVVGISTFTLSPITEPDATNAIHGTTNNVSIRHSNQPKQHPENDFSEVYKIVFGPS